MKMLIFSDIHGNAYAMEALISMMPKIEYDICVFLGDIFGYYYDQKDCFQMLKTIPDLIWLKGNHDVYAVNIFNGFVDEDSFISSYGHSYGQIHNRFQRQEMNFLSSLDSSKKLIIEESKIGLFHGRPKDPLEGRFYNNTQALKNEFCEFNVAFLGHTHCKIDRMIEKTRVISPGSLGQPRDGKGYGFVIFDLDKNACTFFNVKVNSQKLYIDIRLKDPELRKLFDVLDRERMSKMHW